MEELVTQLEFCKLSAQPILDFENVVKVVAEVVTQLECCKLSAQPISDFENVAEVVAEVVMTQLECCKLSAQSILSQDPISYCQPVSLRMNEIRISQNFCKLQYLVVRAVSRSQKQNFCNPASEPIVSQLSSSEKE